MKKPKPKLKRCARADCRHLQDHHHERGCAWYSRQSGHGTKYCGCPGFATKASLKREAAAR